MKSSVQTNICRRSLTADQTQTWLSCRHHCWEEKRAKTNWTTRHCLQIWLRSQWEEVVIWEAVPNKLRGLFWIELIDTQSCWHCRWRKTKQTDRQSPLLLSPPLCYCSTYFYLLTHLPPSCIPPTLHPHAPLFRLTHFHLCSKKKKSTATWLMSHM